MKAAFALIILLFQLQPAAEPTITVEHSGRPSVVAGEEIRLSVKMDLGQEHADHIVKLLPLALENLELLSNSARVERIGVDESLQQFYRWEITLATLDPGNAVVGDIQIELGKDGDDNPRLLTHPGFSLEITERFRWGRLGPWIAMVAVVIAAGVILYIRLSRSTADKDERFESAEQRHRARVLEEIARLRVRAEWDKTVETAFAELIKEIQSNGADEPVEDHPLGGDRLSRLAEQWPDLPAAYRLGEEVRYGGYRPSKREAAFISKVLREIFAAKSGEEEAESEEKA